MSDNERPDLPEPETTGGTDEPRDPQPEPEHVERVDISYEEYAQLRKAAEERDEYLDRLRRAVADYQNLQNRTSRQRAEASEEGVARIVRELLPVIDNLTRAIEATQESDNIEKLLEGLGIIEHQLKTTLQEFGVEAVEAIGKPFDPAVHEAMLQEPSSEHAPNTVVREFLRGYTHKERVLRPSKVSVAVPPPKVERPDED